MVGLIDNLAQTALLLSAIVILAYELCDRGRIRAQSVFMVGGIVAFSISGAVVIAVRVLS